MANSQLAGPVPPGWLVSVAAGKPQVRELARQYRVGQGRQVSQRGGRAAVRRGGAGAPAHRPAVTQLTLL
jgi:hypothetical protein